MHALSVNVLLTMKIAIFINSSKTNFIEFIRYNYTLKRYNEGVADILIFLLLFFGFIVTVVLCFISVFEKGIDKVFKFDMKYFSCFEESANLT